MMLYQMELIAWQHAASGRRTGGIGYKLDCAWLPESEAELGHIFIKRLD